MAKKGETATAAERSALDRGRKKGHATRKAAGKQRRQATKAVGKSRRQLFTEGSLGVRDLTYDELVRGLIANHDGSFEGKQAPLPSRFLAQLESERVRRINQIAKEAGPESANMIVELMGAENENVALQASKYIFERNVGKQPDVIHVGSETAWDRLQQESAFAVVATDEGDVEWEDEDGKSGTEVVASD